MNEVLFYRLCRKLTQYEASFLDAEREKFSEYVRYPHKTRTIRHLITRSLHGHTLSKYNKSKSISQQSMVSHSALVYLLLSVNSPAVYNFNEKGGKKYKIIRSYLDSISEHYKNNSISIQDILSEISEALIQKMATRLFMLSDREHMRRICINT